jgi:hypothetical protein
MMARVARRLRGLVRLTIHDHHIDGFYDPCRRHSALDYVRPIEFAWKFMSKKNATMAA